jgi:hypothetical protein
MSTDPSLGTAPVDGTKIHANASRHRALLYEHAGKIEAQLQAEVADPMAKAEAAEPADVPDGMSVPEELARREQRCGDRYGKGREARAAAVPHGRFRTARPGHFCTAWPRDRRQLC